MNITSWTSEGMDWSSWETVKPWRREYIEAIRKALRELCLKAVSKSSYHDSEAKATRFKESPKVAWANLPSLDISFAENMERLAFSSFSHTIESILSDICQYFSDPTTAVDPVFLKITDTLENYSAWTAEEKLRYFTHGVAFNTEDSMEYPSPKSGFFSAYTWQSLRMAVGIDGVELVGPIMPGTLLDSEHARKWFFMIKTMLCKLKYKRFKQDTPDIVRMTFKPTMEMVDSVSNSGGNARLENFIGDVGGTTPEDDPNYMALFHLYSLNGVDQDGWAAGWMTPPEITSLNEAGCGDGIGNSYGLTYFVDTKYGSRTPGTHGYNEQYKIQHQTESHTAAFSISEDIGGTDDDALMILFKPTVLSYPAVSVSGTLSATIPKVTAHTENFDGQVYNWTEYGEETTTEQYDREGSTPLAPGETSVSFGSDDKLTIPSIGAFPPDAYLWGYSTWSDTGGKKYAGSQVETISVSANASGPVWENGGSVWKEGAFSGAQITWPDDGIPVVDMPALPPLYDLDFV